MKEQRVDSVNLLSHQEPEVDGHLVSLDLRDVVSVSSVGVHAFSLERNEHGRGIGLFSAVPHELSVYLQVNDGELV